MQVKRHIILLTFLLLGMSGIIAQPIVKLDSGAYASLLTCGPGEEFYESFGHTALRVCDSSQGIDVVYNYGSFDFSEPHFYLKFAKGQLNYYVATQSFAEFMFEYEYYGRAVWEQRLLLNNEELNRLYTALEENILPENMFYRYDLFRDNCATRVHKMIIKSINETNLSQKARKAQKNRNGNLSQKTLKTVTYRDLIYKYTAGNELWWRFGTDLLLGARCDRPLTSEEIMMMPIEMMTQYDTMMLPMEATVSPQLQKLAEKKARKLADNHRMLAPQVTVIKDTAVSPTVVFMILFIVVLLLTIMGSTRGLRLFWLDGILFGAAGLTSLVLLFMWFCSDHWCTQWNLNILWANPLFIWLLLRLRKPNRGVIIALLSCLVIVLLMFIGGFPQCFNPAAMLIVITLALRLFVNYKL